MGFEPTTSCLGSKHSTTELRPLGGGEADTSCYYSNSKKQTLAGLRKSHLRSPPKPLVMSLSKDG